MQLETDLFMIGFKSCACSLRFSHTAHKPTMLLPLQGAAEVHIVSAVAEGEAPEWGCDEVWQGGDANLEQCIAVFGIIFKIGDSSPDYFDKIFDTAPTEFDEENTEVRLF